ncbi:FtsX-like permease family protein, partial [bacterium]|nr:FtsX-like permease family protein [bacterium]
MAAINFINLSTARSEKRIKEVGLRKVVGAYRRQLISQFLCEAVSVSFIALAISMILISIVLPHFNNLTAKKLILFQHGDISIFLILIFTALLTGLLAGSYPAIYLSSFNPAKILKGTITRTPKAGNLRKIFVITQFAASIILIISTLVINKQVDFIKTRDPGYKKDNLLYFRMNDSIKTQYTAIKHQLLQNPEIQNVSQCYYLPNWHGPSVNLREWEGKTDDKEIMLYYLSADFDYISTMGMTINQGRDFSETFTSDTQSNIIVNMEAVRQLGMEDPVGKNVNISGSDLRIIGVVNNFNIENIRNKINPFAIFIQPSQARYALLRIKSDNINHLLDDIKESVAEFEGDFPVDIRFMDDMLDSMYRLEMTSVKIVCSFSILAIIISCLGLFGLTAFIAEKRTKEIGIRKTLGASASSIIILLSRQFALLMVVASLIAYPAAYYLSAAWLQNYAFKTRISIDLFIIAGLATIGITVVTVVFQSMKAAYANPLKALRIE